MKAFFDESYPTGKPKLILGFLYTSDTNEEKLKKKINAIKRNRGIAKEIKYSELYSNNKLETAKEIVGEFFSYAAPRFRACVIPYAEEDLKSIPGKLENKRVGVYVDSAQKLILGTLPGNQAVKVYPDEETRIARTKLYRKLKKAKLTNGTKIEEVMPVKSHTKAMMQVCDLLTGAVLQNLYPSNSKTGKHKKEFGAFVANQLGVTDFSKSFSKSNGKFSVHYWKVPSFRSKKQKKSQVVS